MYPLKFKKHLVKKVWGGHGFQELLGIELPTEDNYGESWEVSSHKSGMSFVENGPFSGLSLQELLEKYKEQFVGETVYKKYGNNFPLLIKYLDINDKLSVQVHPSDDYALRVEGEFGKSETWYVINASEDATLILGIKKGINKESFFEKFNKKEFDDIFNIVSVKKGDFIDVKPGLVHASLTGSIVICETQQNSDTTYRIYDFDRLVDGELRPLHLEKAGEVINFDESPIITTSENRQTIELKNCSKEELVRNQYFNIDKLFITGKHFDDLNSNFKILSILSGNGTMKCNDEVYPLVTGDTYFIPALLNIEIEGNLEILKSYL
ncbi:class I mannose-6-phosphate isomerase [Cetobacterium sp. 2A]|uniref:type I phosphomannose isomerase catalytic subunit n=1 Tax=Cetobacterium sp. 2A TaxID=2754723 RepID=UPI00163D1BA2|nr:type I phosphomannose isomerase catalytic subunit [Cetobacterium sp. 2A]MBC2854970.1 class I mannose-6-phosphate isomerase [Cetobacterium sp. 2A]